MKKIILLALVFLIQSGSHLVGQKINNHGVFWGRLMLSDRISPKVKVELYLQKRTQTLQPGDKNIFSSHHFSSIWLWTNYDISKNLKVGFSPFGYFNSKLFNLSESDASNPGVNEFRWSARVETRQEFKFLNAINRYGIEYRWRDFNNTNIYQPNWRIRYTIRLEKPLLRILSKEKPLVVFVANEFFVQFGKSVRNNPSIFDQNRLNVGINYELFKNIRLTVSYLSIIQSRVSGKSLDHADALWIILHFDNLFSQFKKK